MINVKQQELSHHLFHQLQQQFPEIELVEILESPVYPNNIWVSVTHPTSADREIELGELAAEISTEILLNYGHHVSIVSGTKATTPLAT